jgi:hypothetical protein
VRAHRDGRRGDPVASGGVPCAVVAHIRALPVAVALIAILALAGCGTSDAEKETLDQGQQRRFDAGIDDFLAAGTTFIVDVERCARRRGRATCVRKAATALNANADKTRATIADLQRGVGGACAAQLTLAARRVTEALDVLLPIGAAAQRRNVGSTRRLTNRVVAKLRPLTSTVQAERRACKS